MIQPLPTHVRHEQDRALELPSNKCRSHSTRRYLYYNDEDISAKNRADNKFYETQTTLRDKMKKFFIYGGCVSRDTYELIKNENSLTHYIARQSLISAASKPEQRILTDSLPPNFNARMVKGDIQSSLFPKIIQKSKDIDIFLFDILSERLGVHRIHGGTYITNSTELVSSKLLSNFEVPRTLIRFGSDRHFDIWSNSAMQLRDLLRSKNLLEKSYLIKANWTDSTIQGTVTPQFRDLDAATANALYERYYTQLSLLGFKTIEPETNISLSDENHKWGPSQYHYQDDFYTKIIAELSNG